ncbi:hypothetical protein MPTK1_2g00240 [Marchantia polymorpha subsp. ruderalis]|uniref:Uncharacterized protein n=1 Tax=Marchantia polymorpha TaxID=3197 RepID=A0A2R6X9Q0_MARPO|nr:hypothetical protein MARPO_0028s0127 [Marchantia polymorpha]BBN00562.1 hypothetical protein Mp_2g00240 [Marchantia polymorpha subsp. ruderalis]|eukprot:PTQ42835.1 hypothetical protein MARPO_0028s0127 [Marchantia polymorpha]
MDCEDVYTCHSPHLYGLKGQESSTWNSQECRSPLCVTPDYLSMFLLLCRGCTLFGVPPHCLKLLKLRALWDRRFRLFQ